MLLLFFLFFTLFLSANLSARDQGESFFIEHSPITTFVHGDRIEIKAQIKGEKSAHTRFFFRYEGVERFQARRMKKSENNNYVFEFETSQLPVHEFEYYISVQVKTQFLYSPLNAPDETYYVIGESEESLPEIPADFPSPDKEAKRFKLPVSINGSIQVNLKKKDTSLDENGTKTAGNLRVFTNYQSGNLGVDFDSNFSYTNAPYEGDKNVDLSNMMLSISRNNHSLRSGDININESEFTISGFGRRGSEYIFNNQTAYFHFFNVSSQQPKGFNGFGIPKSGVSLLGGSIGYTFLKKAVSLKAVYLTGKDDPQSGVNVGFSPLAKKRKGSVISLVEEVSLFKNKLALVAEFARSSNDGASSDGKETQSDNAWKIGSTLSLGKINIGATYRHIGQEFKPIGYQYFTNNRKGLEANIGIYLGKLNLTGIYNSSRDNVKNDPSQYTTENQNGNLSLQWNISNKFSLGLGYRRDKQNTSFESTEAPFLQDSLTNQLTGTLNLMLNPSVIFNLNMSNSNQTSKNFPQNDNSNLTLALGGSLRAGQTLSFNPTLGYSKMINKYTHEEITTFNSFVTTEIVFIPELLSTVLSGSFTRTEGASSGLNTALNLSSNVSYYLRKLLKFGDISLSIRGNYSKTEMPGFSNSFYSIMFQCDILI
ncbi:hypothetical protein ACFLRM_01330 [Acidobacteriota bacterium]